MQRGPYSNMGPAQSPPLHHPVPQHVSTVPQLRSPPPPMTQQQQQQQAQQQQQYGYAPNNYGQPPFGGFINDPTAQMGFQMGKTAVAAGQEYMEQNFNRYVNVSAMKHYFNVSNKYVVNKLFIVLFPWRHRPWSRQQQPMASSGQSGPMFLPPREDINSPDMYIPVMAFVTYILLSTLLAGLQGAFRPELLGLTATNAFAVVIIELLLLKLGTYLLNISNESQWLDLVAYSGYKFVGIIFTIALATIMTGGKGTGGYVGWSVFAYTYLANAFFLLRSLKYVILPDTASGAHNPIARSQRTKRTYFLFVYSYIIQLAFMWWLSSL
ncbi:YIF1-domain-containing protein [Aureobasidium sp. EXF-12298]|nr:YIF1-domain-containing protein [Aureobasidium sp. EXF-12298]KAI4760390.1 YIF1-domain-containing protein [Aureobasidium sp. EXF-12344]KAI4771398.1 YIF1-domain-containing protein [Aureobasidium sp. EXF-3400]